MVTATVLWLSGLLLPIADAEQEHARATLRLLVANVDMAWAQQLSMFPTTGRAVRHTLPVQEGCKKTRRDVWTMV